MKQPPIHELSRYENKQHTSSKFPYIVYRSVIPDFMNSYPLHWHNEMEIIYISNGSCILSVNKVPLRVFAGDILLILPGTLHSINQNGENNAEYFNIVFDLHLLGHDSPSDICFHKYLQPYLDGVIQLPLRLSPKHPGYHKIHSPLTKLLENPDCVQPGTELFIKAQLFLLFSLFQPLQTKVDLNRVPSYHLSQIQKMKALLQFISIHYADPLSLQDAADFCGYSASYFMKFFKAFTGSTFIEYLNNYRLKKAGELLWSTDLTVFEISETVGFENHTYFIRIFKRKYGITPKKYQLQHRRQS